MASVRKQMDGTGFLRGSMIDIPFRELVENGGFRERTAVFSIGVFDGVHLGHKAIIESLIALKKERDAELSVVITFSENPKARRGVLDTLRLRKEYIASFGVDLLAVIDFSPIFSKITACEFTSLLLEAFRPRGAAVGEDFRFGNPSSEADGRGLERLLREKGCEAPVRIVDSVLDEEGKKISSTRLRQMIEKGELGCFPRLSGQFYRVDLVPLPYRSCSEGLIFSRASIHQLLPPPGLYDAALMGQNGKEVIAEARIDEDYLLISASGLQVLCSECGKDGLLLDSLYLEKRR